MINKKFMFSFLLLSILILSVLPQFVSAQDEEEPDGVFVVLGKAFFGGISDVFETEGENNWFGNIINKFKDDDEGFEENIAFFLFILIFVLFIYDIMDFLPFFEKKGFKWIFSIAFGILAFLFFDKGQIQTLLASYEAVGVTIIAVIPFLIILAFTWKLQNKATDETKPSYLLLSKAIWAFFGIYLFLRLWGLEFNMDNPISIAYLVFVIVALVMFILEKHLVKRFRKWRSKNKSEEGNEADIDDRIRDIELRKQRLIESINLNKNMDDESIKKIKDQIKEHTRTINQLRKLK